MDHPGSSLSPFQGKPLLYGTVTGAIGKRIVAINSRHVHVHVQYQSEKRFCNVVQF